MLNIEFSSSAILWRLILYAGLISLRPCRIIHRSTRLYMVGSSYTRNNVTFWVDVWIWNMYWVRFCFQWTASQTRLCYLLSETDVLIATEGFGNECLTTAPCLCLWRSLEDLVCYLWFCTSDEYCMCCVMMHRCLVTGWCTKILVSDEFERLPGATLQCTSRRLLFHSTGLTCKTSANLTESLKDNEKCFSIDSCRPIVFFFCIGLLFVIHNWLVMLWKHPLW